MGRPSGRASAGPPAATTWPIDEAEGQGPRPTPARSGGRPCPVQPLTQARATARLAGFGDRLELTDALLEFDYGEYEGLTTAEIRAARPLEPVPRRLPNGETVETCAARAGSCWTA